MRFDFDGIINAVLFGILIAAVVSLGMWFDLLRPWFGMLVTSAIISVYCDYEMRKPVSSSTICWNRGWAIAPGVATAAAIAFLVLKSEDARNFQLSWRSNALEEVVNLWESDRKQAILNLNELVKGGEFKRPSNNRHY